MRERTKDTLNVHFGTFETKWLLLLMKTMEKKETHA